MSRYLDEQNVHATGWPHGFEPSTLISGISLHLHSVSIKLSKRLRAVHEATTAYHCIDCHNCAHAQGLLLRVNKRQA